MSTAWALGALAAGLLGGVGAVLAGRVMARETDHRRPHAA
jgi:hypothetical protein